MSKKIELKPVEEWKEYKIREIFDIERGKRLKSEDRIQGNIKYFSATGSNNGLTDMISNPLLVRENKLIYSTFGDSFYIKGEFTASDEISILSIKEKYLKKLNKELGLFLVTVLKQMRVKFMFGRKAFINKYKDEYIKLPSKNNKPNWEYMEEYMKFLEQKHLPSLEEIKKPKIDNKIELKPVGEWEEYKVKELFTIKNLKAYHLEKIEENENREKINYISRTAVNNGKIKSLKIDRKKYLINSKNQITITAEGVKAFYQNEEFICGNKVYGLTNKHLNKYNGLFLINILNYKIFEKYSYSRARIPKKIENEIVKLPSKNNEPDWEYMEEYIKSLPYSNKI